MTEVKVIRRITTDIELTASDFKHVKGDQEMWVRRGRSYKCTFKAEVECHPDYERPEALIISLTAVHQELAKDYTQFVGSKQLKIESGLGPNEKFNRFELGTILTSGATSEVAAKWVTYKKKTSYKGVGIIGGVFSKFDGPDGKDLGHQYLKANLIIEYSFTTG